MPLPSVEAATPEAAVAAARERYGNAVRIVGVRRIRSGGVLGFFATERFVAEVEDVEPPRRTPASKSESARRIEAALSRDPGPLADTGAFLRATEMHRSRPAAARPTSRPAVLPDPVDEVAGLLGAGTGGPDVDLYSRSSVGAARRPAARPAAARPAAPAPAATAAAATAARPASGAAGFRPASAAAPAAARRSTRTAVRPPATPAGPAGPSLFTAALAQVVAGDREVREAVDDAVAATAAASAAEALRALHATAAALAAEPDPVIEPEPAPAPASVLRTPASTPAPSAPAMPLAAALAAAMAAPRAAAPAPAPAPAVAAPAPAAAAPVPVAPVVQEPAPVAVEEPVAEEPAVEVPVPAVAEELEVPAIEVPAMEVPVEDEPAVEDPPAERSVDMDMWADPVPAGPAPAPVAVAPAVMEEPAAEEPAVEDESDDESLVAELLGDRPAAEAALEVEPAAEPVVAEPVIEEEPVVGQAALEVAPADDYATDVLPAVVALPIEVPAPQPVATWSDADLTGPVTGREEAIAEVLRAALAHDTPDDALTDILRGVLASASTQGGVHRGRPPVPATAQRMDREPAWVEASAESDEWEVEAVEQPAIEAATEVLALAATASDPAPLPLDSTAVLPPLSLLPPPTPGAELAVPRLLGRPPVPPARRGLPPVPGQAVARVAAPARPSGLATVTRLPVDTRAGRVLVSSVRERGTSGRELVDPRMVEAAGIVARLRGLGVPEDLLGGTFAADVAASGTYAALTRALRGLPAAPSAPVGAGEVLLVVGPGVETLAAARSLSVSMRLDPERLQWATRGDLAALAPEGSRITSVDTALERKQDAARAGTPTVVAVDAPMRAAGRTWLEQVMAIFSPAAVWAVVDATRKPEDVGPWLGGLPRVDALVVQDTDLTADPAAVLGRTTVPVALLDGVRATPHRWASLLCERLESAEA
ncbi:hypothetical protein [Geodermatophilus sp. SYSU D01119]